jgi:hypothetical protein
MTERFVGAAYEYIARVSADAADLDVEELPKEIGFRLRRQFYFTHLMHTTVGTPISQLVDRVAPRHLRQAHVAKSATAYLVHLLESNSHRVEAARDAEHPLRHQVRKRVRHPIGIARIGQAAGQPPRQLQTLIGRAQQHRATIRAGVGLVERGDNRLGREIGEGKSLCYRVVVQRQRLRAVKGSFSKAFVPLGGVSTYDESRVVVNYPG